ncbi:MAG TPA: hypothetical protein VFJ43_00745, partial [Bacteroidia bacterium]|nr:hypothetical protein [Bacteroidia bacterium]
NKSGPTIIRVKSIDEKYTFAEMKDTSEVGLNFFFSNIPVDSIHADGYKEYLKEKDPSAKPQVYLHNGYLLDPGEYEIEVELAGKKEFIKIKIVKPDPHTEPGRIPLQPGDESENKNFIDK